MRYDPSRAAAFFDEYGEREWTRFEDGRSSSISLAVHEHYLRAFVRPGDRVLDVGAGPGRFTLVLADLGARIVVADVSPEQLRLNRETVARAGVAAAVERWIEADIVDLAPFSNGEFDAVVCYGGPLSYVLDRADDAVRELLRVLRPGGHLLVSVMSLIGPLAFGFRGINDEMQAYGDGFVAAVVASGNLPRELSDGHLEMHLYRPAELRAMLERHGGEVVALSSSGFLFGRYHEETVATLTPSQRALVVRWAIELGAEPGGEGVGEHIIAVARKPPAASDSVDCRRP